MSKQIYCTDPSIHGCHGKYHGESIGAGGGNTKPQQECKCIKSRVYDPRKTYDFNCPVHDTPQQECKHEKFMGGVCVECDFKAFSDMPHKAKPQQDTGWEERKTGKLVGVCNGKVHCGLERCNTEHDEHCEHATPKWEMWLRELGFIHPPLIQFIRNQKQLSERQGYQRAVDDVLYRLSFRDAEDTLDDIIVDIEKNMKKLSEKK